jgi:hypothetical protein
MNIVPNAKQTRATAIETAITLAQQNANNNEYDCRPVSASAANNNGDCVQTLYRHLINIAIQNHDTDARKYNVGVLPQGLKVYYTAGKYFADIVTICGDSSESGVVNTNYHQEWHNALSATVPVGTNISNGTIQNIATVLEAVNIAAGNPVSVLGNRSIAFPHGLAHNLNGNSNETARIETSLNNLDKRGNDSNGLRRFSVKQSNAAHTVAAWATEQIEIIDNLRDHRILIGIGGNGSSHQGHTEIISISNH